ncbi:hypothetical protein PI87_10220 [Ralstonia sp. A12]|uniref:glycosyltransferase family 9 protein n=1 Tax=Ralstonia sp. A12 TaxID=1217052 RepID=UPI0005751E49|nr:glycosyltransferase family 9 protein [Ralstonia sp. A12]KHK56105.1 hypothetical protein PI87_10220 [Ralstonia sp. A12]
MKDPAILVFRSAALGDFILAAPALQQVRTTFPDAKIVLLTIQSASREQRSKVAEYAGSAAAMPWVALAQPHLVDDVRVLEGLNPRSISAVRRSLRGYRFERAILMLDPCAPWLGRFKKMLMLFALLGPVPQYGWRGKGSLNGDRVRLKEAGLLRHHVHGPLQFLAELPQPRSYRDEALQFDLRPSREAETWAWDWLAKHLPEDVERIVVSPGSVQPHKRWPLEKYIELCEALLVARPRAHLLILGTRSDAEYGTALQAVDSQRVHNLMGETSIAQSAALLARCQLLVGNDGGSVHLADAMGCKAVSIVPGIEYPDSIEPWHSKALAIRHAVPCAPCYSFTFCPEGHNQCMLDIPVDQVLENCLSAFAHIRPTPPLLP